MNEFEARLWVVKTIRDVLLDLADSEDVSAEEYVEMEQGMNDAAEIILEALSMDITDVDGDAILATLRKT